MTNKIDLGHDHAVYFTSWAPDRELNPHFAAIPDIERYGLIVEHKHARTGDPCVGSMKFDLPEVRALDAMSPGSFVGAMWQVVSFEPLHVEPSLLCSCGDHGFIRNGRWEPC